MTRQTSVHDYTVPTEGDQDYEQTFNAYFDAVDRDIMVKDIEANLSDYPPETDVMFYATDTGELFLGDGSTWNTADIEVAEAVAQSIVAQTSDLGSATADDLTVANTTSAATGDFNTLDLGSDSGGNFADVAAEYPSSGVEKGQVQATIDAADVGDVVPLKTDDTVYEPTTPWRNKGRKLIGVGGGYATVRPAADVPALYFDPADPWQGHIENVKFIARTDTYSQNTPLVKTSDADQDFDTWDPDTRSNIDGRPKMFTDCVFKSDAEFAGDQVGIGFLADMDNYGWGLGTSTECYFDDLWRCVDLRAHGTNGSGTDEKGYTNGFIWYVVFNDYLDCAVHLEGDGRPVNSNYFYGISQPIFGSENNPQTDAHVKIRSVNRAEGNDPTVTGNVFHTYFYDTNRLKPNGAPTGFIAQADGDGGGMGLNSLVTGRQIQPQYVVAEDSNGDPLPSGKGFCAPNFHHLGAIADFQFAPLGNSKTQAALSTVGFADDSFAELPEGFAALGPFSNFQNSLDLYHNSGSGDELHWRTYERETALSGSETYTVATDGVNERYDIIDGDGTSTGPLTINIDSAGEQRSRKLKFLNISSRDAEIYDSSGSLVTTISADETAQIEYHDQFQSRGWYVY